MRWVIFPLGLMLLITACNANKTESLLTDRTSCTVENCSNTQTRIDGELAISSEQSSYQLNVDQGDVIEISGKCDDLGIRENYIQVQAYESENSPEAYMDNDLSYLCTANAMTTEIRGLRCFWVTQGKPLLDGNDPLRELPRCHNGRFAFSVRLGRILRTTESLTASSDDTDNPRKKYFIKFKLFATPPGENRLESQWSGATVDRTISRVTFNQTTDLNAHTCKIKVDAYKNISALTNIYYQGTLTRVYGNNTTVAPVPIYPAGFRLNYSHLPGESILDYNLHYGAALGANGFVIPGVRHKLNIRAQDYTYNYTGLVAGEQQSEASNEVECGYQRGTFLNPTRIDTPITNLCNVKVCTLPFSFPSIAGDVEWMIIKNLSNWDENFSSGGRHVRLTPASFPTLNFDPNTYPGNTCVPSGSPTTPGTHTLAGTYGIAARYIGPGGERAAWSEVITCSFGN